MRRHLTVLLSLLFLATAGTTPTRAQAQGTDGITPVEEGAKVLVELFREHPRDAIDGGYKEIFASIVLTAVTETQLTNIFTQYVEKYGVATRVLPHEIKSPTLGTFYFIFEKGYRMPMRVVVEKTSPHRITGFQSIGIAEPLEQAVSLEEVTQAFTSLSGDVSFLLAEIDDGGVLMPIGSHRAREPEAIGSTFKLYVLGALVRAIEAGRRSWSEVVHLEEEYKSQLSGFLHTWPTESPLTLHTLATLMISRSDNTATDLLIGTLGRQHVEAAQEAMGHDQPALNMPFLTTRELFILKSDSMLAESFLQASEAERRALLEREMTDVNYNTITPWSEPIRIESIEWFASARHLALAMAWFRQKTNARAVAREILSVNKGLNFDEAKWTFVGFKGGSEPGLINTTFLLRSVDGTWYALSTSWNNPDALVDKAKFFSLVKQVLRQVE